MPTCSNPLGLACAHTDCWNRPKVLVHIKMKLDVPRSVIPHVMLESVRYDSMNKMVKSRSSLNQHRAVHLLRNIVFKLQERRVQTRTRKLTSWHACLHNGSETKVDQKQGCRAQTNATRGLTSAGTASTIVELFMSRLTLASSPLCWCVQSRLATPASWHGRADELLQAKHSESLCSES